MHAFHTLATRSHCVYGSVLFESGRLRLRLYRVRELVAVVHRGGSLGLIQVGSILHLVRRGKLGRVNLLGAGRLRRGKRGAYADQLGQTDRRLWLICMATMSKNREASAQANHCAARTQRR